MAGLEESERGRKQMQKINRISTVAVAVCLGVALSGSATAAEVLKLAVGQRGNWDTSVPELGKRAGIFKKHGIDLDILYTQGGGETQQAVISGSVDIGIAAGIMGVLSAFSKGAPVRIIASQAIGGGDLFWYVKADSAAKGLKDLAGKTIAYSTNGSSTHGMVLALIAEHNLQAKPLATGGAAATLTSVMSNQVDIGWSAPPFGLDLLDQGRIRIVASGNDASAFKDQTVRVNIANAEVLKSRADAVNRFSRAYRETIDWMYSGDDALKIYAEFVGLPEGRAKRTRDDFFPRPGLNPDDVVGLKAIVSSAVELKYTSQLLSQEQLAEMIRIPPRH
jgi:NitT/TauT family transport system substrate-binding protein